MLPKEPNSDAKENTCQHILNMNQEKNSYDETSNAPTSPIENIKNVDENPSSRASFIQKKTNEKRKKKKKMVFLPPNVVRIRDKGFEMFTNTRALEFTRKRATELNHQFIFVSYNSSVAFRG